MPHRASTLMQAVQIKKGSSNHLDRWTLFVQSVEFNCLNRGLGLVVTPHLSHLRLDLAHGPEMRSDRASLVQG